MTYSIEMLNSHWHACGRDARMADVPFDQHRIPPSAVRAIEHWQDGWKWQDAELAKMEAWCKTQGYADAMHEMGRCE